MLHAGRHLRHCLLEPGEAGWKYPFMHWQELLDVTNSLFNEESQEVQLTVLLQVVQLNWQAPQTATPAS